MASAKAASVAALSPNTIVTPILPFGHCSQIFGASRFRRLLQIDQRGQRLIVDVDQLGGIARLRLGLGDDEGDAVADATNPIGKQNRPRGRKPFGSAQDSGMKNGGMPPTLSVAASAPVSTQSNAGRRLCRVASTRLITAWACGDSTATP